MTTITKDAQIDIHLGEPGRAQLLIDGVDLSNLVYRTEFVMEANHIGRLVLYCHARKLRIHGAGDVVAGDECTTPGEIPPLRSTSGNALAAQVCEVCGARAAVMIVDQREMTAPGDTVRSFRPVLPAHFFCREHHRPWITILPSGAVTIEPDDLRHFQDADLNLRIAG